MKALKKQHNYIVISYFIFGTFWILFSELLLKIYIKDIKILENIENAIEIFFVFFTTFLLHFLLKKQYNQHFSLSSAAKGKEVLLKREESSKRKLLEIEQLFFDFMIELFETENITDEDYIKKIFYLAYEMIDEVDFGSAQIIRGNKIKFIDCIGFDLDSANRMDKNLEKFDITYDKIKYIKDSYKTLDDKLNKHTKEEKTILSNIKESVYIGIAISEKLEGGISLDIARNSAKSFSNDSLNKLKALQHIINSTYKIKKANDSFKEFHHDIISSFLTVFEHHDPYTKGHSEAVADISVQIGKKMNLSQTELNDLYWAGILHDIGKIVVPAEILNKKGRLNDDEFSVIKKHPVIGYEIISKSKSLKKVAQYVLNHHERWDGRGYPRGIRGDDIPVISQIISVADSWHAMISERSYKKILSEDSALNELLKNSGTQFPPEIVEAFYKLKKETIE